MRFVFTSYVYTPEYNKPEAWLKHVRFYGGILEALALQDTVISIEQIDYEGEYQYNGVQYYFKRTSKVGRHVPIRLYRFIKSLSPDVVFVHGLLFPFQILQLRAYFGGKVKIIVQHHAEQPSVGIKRLLQQFTDQYIDAYLFASRQLGLTWVAKGNLAFPQKIHEVMEVSSIFYPVDKQTSLTKTGITGAPVFLWVGRLNSNKDPVTVFDAFLQFARLNTSARLYMIYHTDELLSEIKQVLDCYPDSSNSVILVGKLPHEELLYWYNSADFIISGSFYEGSGTAICEAMSCGIFPLLTDIPSFRMMTDDGKYGFLYEAGNGQKLLNCLLKSTELDIENVQTAILDHYKTEFSFSAIAGKISQIASLL